MLARKVKWLMAICAVMIGAHIVNLVTHGSLYQYGLYPRQLDSLWGIFAAPFLHSNLGHLLNNLLGLVIFSGLLFVHSLRRYLWSSVFIITLTGLLVWSFGRNAMHIGASGWIFGLWSLCIATAWFDRKLINIFIALVVVFLYGGMLFGVLPGDPRVSYESHLFGVLAGVLCAFIQAKVFNNKNYPLLKRK
jgi:membrane associated rhomboid family serine protease